MSVILALTVVPQAGKSALLWHEKRGQLVAYLKSPPEKNKANTELIALIRKTLGRQVGAVTIVGGMTTRHKRVRIETKLSEHDVLVRCGMRGTQQCVVTG